MTRRFDMGTEKLLAETDAGGVLRITLNNPESFNSLTTKMMTGLDTLLSQTSASDDIRAVLIAGAGDQAFASGANIGEHSERAQSGTTNPDRGSFVASLLSCTKPVLAMIHGYCMGGGLLLAMCADFRMAADDAVFAVPAARLGVAYPLAAVQLLVDIVGRGAALRILLSGDRFDADAARNMGLLSAVHPKAELSDAVEGLLTTLTANAPLSMGAAKASVAHAVTRQPHDSAHVVALIDGVWASADAREGMDAFFTKRDPWFKGS